jgi:fermentation-respiration switch protein FrsA (DUF1100 family)
MPLTQTWDKTFPKSAKVDHRKVTFRNRYGITLAADLYMPKHAVGRKLAALAVGGPFGAVKEQSSGLYAQTMAERGYGALAFDASFTGESGGEPRNVASPDINTEDFMAAVDFLGLHPLVDRERIGVIGICGWGGMALNAVAADKRVKAVVASTMYDMTRVMSKGYNDSVTAEQRAQTLEQLSRQRWKDAANGKPAPAGLPARLKGGEAQFMVDYHDYYMTKRGYPRAVNSGNAWTMCTAVVHEHADPELHQGDFAASHPVHPRRKGPLALLQRNRLRGRGAAEGTDDRQGRPPRRPLRPHGHDSVRRDRWLLRPAPEGAGVTDRMSAMVLRHAALLLILATLPAAHAAEPRMTQSAEQPRIVMTAGTSRFTVALDDNETAAAFAKMLPVTFEMSDLNRNEKKVRLPRGLPTRVVRPGTIRAGDVMLWGDDTLVVFYETFESPYSYTRIGRIENPSGMAQMLGPGDVHVSFSRP